jgi:hypothetical protein
MSGQCLSPSEPGHALTPGNHRSLGEPLPHQQANSMRSYLRAESHHLIRRCYPALQSVWTPRVCSCSAEHGRLSEVCRVLQGFCTSKLMLLYDSSGSVGLRRAPPWSCLDASCMIPDGPSRSSCRSVRPRTSLPLQRHIPRYRPTASPQTPTLPSFAPRCALKQSFVASSHEQCVLPSTSAPLDVAWAAPLARLSPIEAFPKAPRFLPTVSHRLGRLAPLGATSHGLWACCIPKPVMRFDAFRASGLHRLQLPGLGFFRSHPSRRHTL